MTGYNPARYGDVVRGRYDSLYPGEGLETDAAVAKLAELAMARPERSVLEFGIGTGRLALGLHQRGIRVAGIDGSDDMVAELRRKPGGSDLPVTIGDYRSTELDDQFAVVALVFNGIFDPRGRSAQLDIFRNAHRHLAPGGCFVVESFVLSDADRSGEWTVSPRYVGDEHVELQLARFDVEESRIERTLVHMRSEGLDFLTVFDTYAAPGELDVMAEVTGFRRVERFANWSGGAFGASSARQVSVYEAVAE
jgi:SAM-dependent methyltransferase